MPVDIKTLIGKVVITFVIIGAADIARAAPLSIALIKGHAFTPQYGLDVGQESFDVTDFSLDKRPVTSFQFSQFLKENPLYNKGKINSHLADSNYLKNFKPLKDAPVVSVSWFAAQAYCESNGGRLPTTLEWEYVASASERLIDARKDPKFLDAILKWYASPASKTLPLKFKKTKPNMFGVYDLHGLIWEWTFDFNSFFVTSDNRQDGDQSKNLFCGNSATNAKNKEDYAAFMRYAMRSSLSASFNLTTLGFRCAYEIKK